MPLLAARRAAMAAVLTAVAATLALAAIVRLALGSARGQRWDDQAMTTVVVGRDARLTVLSVLGYVSIGAIVAVALGCVGLALLRGRARLAVGAIVVLAGANITTQVLKQWVLERPDLGVGTLNSLPSGHTTVVSSAVGATLLVAPAVLRSFVVLTGGFATTLTGASTIVAGWHRPADVVAALAVSLMWTAIVAAVVHGRRQRVAGTWIASGVGCAAGLFGLIVIGVRPSYGWEGFVQAASVLGVVTVLTVAFVVSAAAVSPTE